MILISDQGLITGPNPAIKNRLTAIDSAISAGYDCRIVVKSIKGRIYLVGNEPYERIHTNFLVTNRDRLWIECVDDTTTRFFAERMGIHGFNFMPKSKDSVTITSNGILWWNTPQLLSLPKKGILCLELFDISDGSEVEGVCSEYIGAFSEKD